MNIPIAMWICYGIAIEFLGLVLFDVWLKSTNRELITDAARNFNSATGWLVAGTYIVIGVHLFALPYLILFWHKIMG